MGALGVFGPTFLANPIDKLNRWAHSAPMGREIKRVPADFDWPQGRTWFGYEIGVEFPRCFDCNGDGVRGQRECTRCQGHGDLATDELRAWQDAMPDAPIPSGDGWQLWETVGDSPMSPVFATSDELVEWMMTHPWRLNPSLSGPSLVRSTRYEAERLVAVGTSLGSFIITRDGELIDGVTAAIR